MDALFEQASSLGEEDDRNNPHPEKNSFEKLKETTGKKEEHWIKDKAENLADVLDRGTVTQAQLDNFVKTQTGGRHSNNEEEEEEELNLENEEKKATSKRYIQNVRCDTYKTNQPSYRKRRIRNSRVGNSKRY